MIEIENMPYWTWLSKPGWFELDVTGKYLFFSSNRQVLFDIAKDEMENHGFMAAKISTRAIGDYVLCLYWTGPERKYELAERAKAFPVRYRYWKSDADTLAGKYSNTLAGRYLAKKHQITR